MSDVLSYLSRLMEERARLTGEERDRSRQVLLQLYEVVKQNSALQGKVQVLEKDVARLVKERSDTDLEVKKREHLECRVDELERERDAAQAKVKKLEQELEGRCDPSSDKPPCSNRPTVDLSDVDGLPELAE